MPLLLQTGLHRRPHARRVALTSNRQVAREVACFLSLFSPARPADDSLLARFHPDLFDALGRLKTINRGLARSFVDLVDLQRKVDYRGWRFDKMHAFIFIKRRLRLEVMLTSSDAS